MVSRLLIATAALLIAIATGLGAYASHGLDAVLDADSLATFETAIHYQFFHALGIIGLGALAQRRPGRRILLIAAVTIIAGIVLFCGGVYSSSLDGPGWLSSLAPVGGVSLIVGWLLVAFALATGGADS